MRRWVCLDVGETLIDETRVWSTWAEVLELPPFTLHGVIGAAIAQGGDHRDAFTRLGVEWEAVMPEVARRYGGFRHQDLYPDALPALAALREAGYGIAVIANQPASRHDELLALGVEVDELAMSDALGVAKPDPRFFAEVVRRCGGDPSAIAYVGDRIDNDVAASAAAGLRAVWLRRGPWGLWPTEAPGAALVVDSLDDLVARIADAF